MPHAELTPPAPDALHREFRRVVRCPHIDHPLIAIYVIGAVRNGCCFCQTREIVDVHFRRLPFFVPFPSAILEVPDPFLLLGVDRDHRFSLRQEPLGCFIEIPKLAVAIDMRSTLLVLAVCLPRVFHFSQSPLSRIFPPCTAHPPPLL